MEIPHSASLLDGLELCTSHVRSISTKPLTRAAELCDAVPKGACFSKNLQILQTLQSVCQLFEKFRNFLTKQAPFGTASQSSAARVRGLVEMLRTCEVHSSKPSSNETLCGISILLLREIFSVLNDEDFHRLKLCLLYERCRLHVAMF